MTDQTALYSSHEFFNMVPHDDDNDDDIDDRTRTQT